ncbi:MAG: hypothetical protein AB2598_00940 [Candidatus Thiodiazotropha sp.]
MPGSDLNPRLAREPAYVLLLLRDRGIADWTSLCEYFGWDPEMGHTGHSMLNESLNRLVQAGLISLAPNDNKITVLDTLGKIQAALGISLKDIINRNDDGQFTVKPVFGKPHDPHCATELFVLMPFLEKMQPVYDDHIKSVAERLSLSVARADDFFSTESVMQEVWNAICSAEILIADCTGRNPNVFYEIGLAHTMGKPVVLITQDETDIPFDLRHRRYIVYEYTPRGMKKFEKQLCEALKTIRMTA